MSDVSYVPPLKKDTLYVQYIPSMPMLLLDTLALNLRTSLVTISSLGTPLCQTGAAKVVTVLSTKLTLLLKPSTMRMNVKQQKPQSVEYYLVNYNNNNNNKVYYLNKNIHIKNSKPSFLDQDKAVVQNEFKYKNCCIDGQG